MGVAEVTLGLAKFQDCKVPEWGPSLGLCSPTPPLPSVLTTSQDLRDTNGSLSYSRLYHFKTPDARKTASLIPWTSTPVIPGSDKGLLLPSLHTPRHAISQPPLDWSTPC